MFCRTCLSMSWTAVIKCSSSQLFVCWRICLFWLRSFLSLTSLSSWFRFDSKSLSSERLPEVIWPSSDISFCDFSTSASNIFKSLIAFLFLSRSVCSSCNFWRSKLSSIFKASISRLTSSISFSIFVFLLISWIFSIYLNSIFSNSYFEIVCSNSAKSFLSLANIAISLKISASLFLSRRE